MHDQPTSRSDASDAREFEHAFSQAGEPWALNAFEAALLLALASFNDMLASYDRSSRFASLAVHPGHGLGLWF
jgi:hypothetical protein